MSGYIETGWETGFFQTPNEIFDREDLNSNEKICYLYLCRCADNSKKAFPSHEVIGNKTGTSKSTAKRAVKSLEEKGYIVVTRRKVDNTKNLTNLYTIIHPKSATPKGGVRENPGGVRENPGVGSERTQGWGQSDTQINTQFINTHSINTQQQQEELKKSVVVVREKYESLFQKKLTKKQAEDLITLADKHQVDLIKKMENTYKMHRVEPRKSIVAAIKYAIVNGDWEIASSTVSTPKPLPKAVAEQLNGKRGQQELTREQLEAKKLEIQRKIAMLEEEIVEGF
jgi:biotin operon repressor